MFKSAFFKNIKFFIVSVILIIFDQYSKYFIVSELKLAETATGSIKLLPFLSLTYVENRGITFGLFTGGEVARYLLSFLTMSVIVILFVSFFKIKSQIVKWGLAVIIGGAFGNLIDRVRIGYVVDFVDISVLYFPWIFNLADIFINIGVIILLIDNFYGTEKANNK